MLRAKHVSVSNHLLSALPRKDYRKLLPFLEPVELTFAQVLYEPYARIRYVYFPVDCFVSMLTSVDDDRVAEVGLVGSEGMVGVPVVLGAAVSPFRAVVQGGGRAMRMNIADFRREFSESDALRRELFLFTHLLMIQIAQTAACNRFHVVTTAHGPLAVDDPRPRQLRRVSHYAGISCAHAGRAAEPRQRGSGQPAANASSSATDAAPSPSSTREASKRLPAGAIRRSKTSTPSDKLRRKLRASPAQVIHAIA